MALNIPKTLSNHPSLVGIVRFPLCNWQEHEVDIPLIIKDGNGYFNIRQRVDMANTITSSPVTSNGYTIPKSSITDFYPYTFYALTDGETEPLILQPQHLPSTFYVKGEFALSHQPVERYYVKGYKGDENGQVYNITNLNQMMLPTATNEGLNYMNANANTIMQNRKSQITGNILNGTSTIVSAIATGGLSLIGGGVQSTISGLMGIQETNARNKDMTLTPNSISSFGSPSTRKAFNTDSVRIIKYSIKEEYKNKINNFVDRYGNKFMGYGTIDLKSYKGYIKFIDPKINGGILEEHKLEIKRILERGVKVE